MKAIRVLCSVLLGGAAGVAVGCGDVPPLGVPSRTPPPAASLEAALAPSADLLRCAPLAFDSVTQTIGPEGGFLAVGPHTLTVPPGALAEPVSITAVAPPDTVNRVTFQPAGLIFERPAYLAMSYANCGVLGDLLRTRIACTTDALEIVSFLPSLDDFSARQVTGLVRHFSTYAVAW
jgi:hypothetical protein